MKLRIILLLLLVTCLTVTGCSKQAVDKSEAIQVMIWPKPPDIARIKFLNSISVPEDLNIKESSIKKFFNLFTGVEEKSIIKPYGLETDRFGRIFVVDSFKKAVHVFDETKKTYHYFPRKDVSLEYPIDIAINKNGLIYITDSKRAVVSIFSDAGNKYEREIGEGLLKRPTGIAINEKSGELLVVDTGSSRIMRYDLNTYMLKGIVGRDGEEEGMFHFPVNIFVSKDGRIFVSDSLNFRIQIFTHDWKYIDSFGKVGNSPGFFSRPRGVAVDSEGNIYVVDALFDNIQIFNVKGQLLMDFGGPGQGYGEFWLPSGLFIDSGDRIYVSDTYNKRIQIFQYLQEREM